jgi:hypothetical protein
MGFGSADPSTALGMTARSFRVSEAPLPRSPAPVIPFKGVRLVEIRYDS